MSINEVLHKHNIKLNHIINSKYSCVRADAFKHLLSSVYNGVRDKNEYDTVIKYFKCIPISKCLYKLIYEYFYVEWYYTQCKRIIFQMTKDEVKKFNYHDYNCYISTDYHRRIAYPLIDVYFNLTDDELKRIDAYEPFLKSFVFKINDNYYKNIRKENFKDRIKHAENTLRKKLKSDHIFSMWDINDNH